MRTVDADALEKEGWSLHRDIQVDKNTWEYQTKPLRQVPTIEPRCEACEAFNKTRLLIPQPEPQWIPCSERLPEEDVEVLISYRYKEGEGDTSHTYIDITTYGQMYFGGNKVGNHKHWRAPFEYFVSNYEVIAWMPLPEPYREGE